MPIRDPNKYRDKTADWMTFYTKTRCRELKPTVTPALLAEHAEDPRGGASRHSPALQDVLNFVHAEAIDGKAFAYAEVPYQKYRLGILRGRGVAPEIRRDRAFKTEREAVHAVLLERLGTLGLLPKAAEPAAKPRATRKGAKR